MASDVDLKADAARWAAHFALDVFNNHVSNHEHDCTETCVKYVKQKLEATSKCLNGPVKMQQANGRPLSLAINSRPETILEPI